MDAPPDPRLDFLGGYVQKTMKLKPEKWSRLLATEELKAQVIDYLDHPEPPVLIVMQNAAAQLLLCTSFPVSLKSKATYFIKKKRQPVPKDDIGDYLVVGDMATKPIEQLASLVDEVFVPLLSNPSNHKAWPPVVAQDVKKHVHSLKSTVYQVKGQVSGQTVLPMPVGVERVHEAERQLLTSGGEDVDLYLKSAIEGVVIKWATQINDVLTKDSSQAFSGGQNPNPAAEIYFWNSRLRNLEYVYDQLRDDRVRKMAIILEKTDSAYFPCFKTLFHNIVAALTEAKDICLYLKPLIKHFTTMEETDFADLIPQLKPLMHTVCLVWANSRYYCNSNKIIVLLKQICNLLIQHAQHYLDPSSIFQSDVEEAKQRIALSVTVFKAFRQAFDECKDNMAYYFKDRKPVLWTFHPKIVFERFQAFLNRLQTIQWFFDTVQEFLKLEKIEVGGLKGRALSGKIVAVSQEFNDHFAVFASKTYDVLDPEDETFLHDYSAFQMKIRDLDRRLASILCQAFDDCNNLESTFKLINIVGSVLERPLIKEEFTGKYNSILEMLNMELVVSQELYEDQMNYFEINGHMRVYKLLPPVAGALKWTEQLRARVKTPVVAFKSLEHPIAKSPEAATAAEKCDSIIKRLKEFDEKYFTEWTATVEEKCAVNLEKSLLTRRRDNGELELNFDPNLVAILREVHYLKLMNKRNIPAAALKISEREETFRSHTAKLNQTIDWYNKIRRMCTPVEFNLVKDIIKRIDKEVEKGMSELNWNSSDLVEYIQNLFDLVGNLEKRIQKTQDNVNTMRTVMAAWLKCPVFERRDGKKDTLLCLEEKADRIQKRYSEMSAAASEIHRLLNENQELFNIAEHMEAECWKEYVQYIDSIVSDSVLRTVGCSLGYLAEHMDPGNNLAPLFEVQLELRDPDLVFLPPLDLERKDGFPKIVESLTVDILSMAKLIPRITTDPNEQNTYEEDTENNADILEMKLEVIEGVKTVMEEASDFASSFEAYSYLWLDDRQSYMAQFLTYGRQLTYDEMELVAANDSLQPPANPPKMELFREQIDNYESLFFEIEELESFQIFNGWFQVDVRPFKQALLNTVRKWGNMFKQHLMEHVTSSLADLATFIHKADEGLLQTVQEGDYDTLVNVMGFLMNVKERQAATDDMFEPLRQTIELLKAYDQELPEEVNVLLQELPEQWSNTKKIAITVKQQVAPLQAGEVSCIRKKIQAFDAKQNQYRDNFRKYSFMRFDCVRPYNLLDQTDVEIEKFEDEMSKIQESASLFEVNVPEFKPLRQCRKELKMLKQLWDYVNIVQSCIEDWKTTPWRKVDVENMDIECKKFAKEIRALDKEMRVWDTYITLEATVKNMLTSLKAVGELQNPAIRERHWNQLMTSTKV